METHVPLRDFSSEPLITDPPEFRDSSEEGRKTLLVVDDEAAVRELMALILCTEGYTVIQAEGAAEAMRLAAAANIHLLLTDFSMPGTDGLELSRRFRVVYPQAPVLMVSGSLEGLEKRSEDLERFWILQKPFEISDLINKVRALLTDISPLPKAMRK